MHGVASCIQTVDILGNPKARTDTDRAGKSLRGTTQRRVVARSSSAVDEPQNGAVRFSDFNMRDAALNDLPGVTASPHRSMVDPVPSIGSCLGKR